MICARLSLAENTPLMGEDAASSRLYLVPYLGNAVAIPDASGVWQPSMLPDTGLSVGLAQIPANTMRDAWLVEAPNGVALGLTEMTPQAAAQPATLVQISAQPQGSFNYVAGMSVIVDGQTSQTWSQSARSAGGLSGYSAGTAVGLRLDAPQQVKQIKAWSPIDNSFIGNNAAVGWQLRAGHPDHPDPMAAPIVATGTAPAGYPSTIVIDIPNGPTSADWWLVFNGNGINAIYICEMQAFVQAPVEPVFPRSIVYRGGMPVNGSPLSVVTDSGIVNVANFRAVYLGSVAIGPVAGQARADFSYKPDVRMDVWNYFHPQMITLTAGDNADFINGSRTYRPFSSPSGYNFGISGRQDIKISIISGIKRRSTRPQWRGAYFQNSLSGPSAVWTAIGVDSTSAPTGTWAMQNFDNTGTAQGLLGAVAACTIQPFDGIKVLRPLEGCRGDVTGFWQETNQALSVSWEC